MADAGAEALTAAGQGTHEPAPAQSARVAGERFQRVAEEQAALRRIAVQVARAGPPEEVFAAVTDEVHRLLGNDFTTMCRFNTDSWKGDCPSPSRSSYRCELLPARVVNQGLHGRG